MKTKILTALREHGSLYADEIAQIVGLDKGVIVDALRQLADDFQIYPEQVGMMRDSGKWFLVAQHKTNVKTKSGLLK